MIPALIPAGVAGASILGIVYAILRWFTAYFIAKLILALGVGYAVYEGGNTLVDQASAYINTAIGGLPADAYQLLSMCGFFEGLSIILAAYSMALTWQAAKFTLVRVSS
jgi:hypothetical protein